MTKWLKAVAGQSIEHYERHTQHVVALAYRRLRWNQCVGRTHADLSKPYCRLSQSLGSCRSRRKRGASARSRPGGTGRRIRPPPLTGGGKLGSVDSCSGVALSSPLATVDASMITSYWLHNCSVVGLIDDTGTGARSFVFISLRRIWPHLSGTIRYCSLARRKVLPIPAAQTLQQCMRRIALQRRRTDRSVLWSGVSDAHGSYPRRDSNCRTSVPRRRIVVRLYGQRSSRLPYHQPL